MSHGNATSASAPVLIAGAGPAGLTAALELSRMGVLVRIVERQPWPRAVPATAVALEPRTLTLLEQRAVALRGLPGARTVTATAVYAGRTLLGRVRLTAGNGGAPFLVLPRVELERQLRTQLAEQGVRVEYGTELVAGCQPAPDQPPDPDGPGVRTVLRRQDRTIERVTVPYLVAAYGAATSRADLAGRGFMAAVVRLDGELPDDEISVLLGRNGFLTAYPFDGHRFWCVGSDPDLQQALEGCSPATVRTAEVAFSTWVPAGQHLCVPRQPRRGRLFAPCGYGSGYRAACDQGVNAGIQDMINLSWKLAMVRHGSAVSDVLGTYPAERLAAARAVWKRAESAAGLLATDRTVVRHLVRRVAPVFLDSRFLLRLAADLTGEVLPDLRISPLSARSLGPGGLQPGDIVPDLRLAVSEAGAVSSRSPRQARLWEQLHPGKLTLLVVPGRTPSTGLPSGWDEPAGRWRQTAVAHLIAPPAGSLDDQAEFGRVFGGGPSLVLVRPDCCVAFAGRPRALPELHRWLRTWFPYAPDAGLGNSTGLAAAGR